MTGELPQTLMVMLSDEQSAGRIVVELNAFIQFNEGLSRQVLELEARIGQLVPQLARRGKANGERSRSQGPHSGSKPS